MSSMATIFLMAWDICQEDGSLEIPVGKKSVMKSKAFKIEKQEEDEEKLLKSILGLM